MREGDRTQSQTWLERARGAWRWVRTRDAVVLLGALLPVAGAWLFFVLAGEVGEGETRALDERLLLALRNPADVTDPLGPPWLEEVGRDLTALGGVAVLLLLTVGVAGGLYLQRQVHAALLVLGATGGGVLLGLAAKALVARPRPQLVPHLSYVTTASFPSGHSMLSAVVYLTLGALLARLTGRWRYRLFVLGYALLLTFLVGVSRVYLGVHYPTDVLAGWSLGLAWATVCSLLARWLQRRGQVESPPPRP
jgi:undecaprenyl-diphosphatase